MKYKNKFAELAGWYGAIAILTAYALVSFKIIPSSSLSYQLLNLTGSIGVITISLNKKAKQPAVLNIVWAIIAAIAIINLAIIN